MSHLSQFSTDQARSIHIGHHLLLAIHLRSDFIKVDRFLEIKSLIEVKCTVHTSSLSRSRSENIFAKGAIPKKAFIVNVGSSISRLPLPPDSSEGWHHGKMNKEDLNFPRQELSNSGLGIVVALLVR